MRRFILVTVWMSVACAAAGDEPKAEANKTAVAKALESFTGTWEIVVVQPDGATKDAH